MQGYPNGSANPNNYPPQQHPMMYRTRGGNGSATDLPAMGTPNNSYTSQHPPTPPLVFTTQFGGTPPHQQDPLATSPYVEPLQVNYQAVLGRRNSSTTIELEDSPITVTCRTKGTGRSPYLAPIQAEPPAEQERSVRHNPYTFSHSGNSTPMQVSTPTQNQPPHVFQSGGFYLGAVDQRAADAYLAQGHSQRLDTGFELPPEVVHRSLKDRCRYIQFPTNLPSSQKGATPGSGTQQSGGANSTAPGNPNSTTTANNGGGSNGTATDGSLPIALFIGQVRFETTPAELLWLIHRTCGACASHLESRGAGCYLLYCRSEADLTLVRSLHKRILFDIGGVWLARTADEVDALCEYVALDAAVLSKKARLPRDSMVVEELKADALNGSGGRRGHGGGGGGGNANAGGGGSATGASANGNAEKRSVNNNSFSNSRRGGGGGGAGGGGAGGGQPQEGASPHTDQYPQQSGKLPSYHGAAPPYPGYPQSPHQTYGEHSSFSK